MLSCTCNKENEQKIRIKKVTKSVTHLLFLRDKCVFLYLFPRSIFIKKTYLSRVKSFVLRVPTLFPDPYFHFLYCEAADFRLTDRTLSNHHITRRKFILSVYPPSGRMRQGSYRKMRFFLQSPNRRPRQTFPRASASLVLSMCTCRLIVSTARHRQLYHGMRFP